MNVLQILAESDEMFLHTGKFRTIRLNYDRSKYNCNYLEDTGLLAVWLSDANITGNILCSVYHELSAYYSLQSKISLDKHYCLTYRHV